MPLLSPGDPFPLLTITTAGGQALTLPGAFAGDFGLWVRSAGDAWRYRRQVGAEQVRLLFNITAEFAAPIGPFTICCPYTSALTAPADRNVDTARSATRLNCRIAAPAVRAPSRRSARRPSACSAARRATSSPFAP